VPVKNQRYYLVLLISRLARGLRDFAGDCSKLRRLSPSASADSDGYASGREGGRFISAGKEPLPVWD